MKNIIFKPSPFTEEQYKALGMFYIEGTAICIDENYKIDFSVNPVDLNGDYKGISKDLLNVLNEFYQLFIDNKNMVSALDRLLFNAGYHGKVEHVEFNQYATELIIKDKYYHEPI